MIAFKEYRLGIPLQLYKELQVRKILTEKRDLSDVIIDLVKKGIEAETLTNSASRSRKRRAAES